MSKICGECVFFPGCSRYEGKTHDSEEAETCRAYLACEEDEEEVAAGDYCYHWKAKEGEHD